MAEINLFSPDGKKYRIGKLLGEPENYKVYECFLGDKWYLLKISTDPSKNHFIDREEIFLKDLYISSQKTEERYVSENPGKELTPLNSHFFFPLVHDSFIAKEQQDRSVLILDLSHIAENRSDLTPLSFILEKDNMIVDPRTSAWIMGKLLKMLTFTHFHFVLINDINLDNILINKKKHYVSIFNWSMATRGEDVWSVSPEDFASEISQISRMVLAILGGGNVNGGYNAFFEIPDDPQLVDTRYIDYIKFLCRGQETSAYLAHKGFYKLIYELWPRGFHPYTVKTKS